MTLYSLDGIGPKLPVGFSFIAPSASLIGNIDIGEDASVWFGVVIRGDNENISLGRSSNIQDNSVVHTDPGYPVNIGEGSTIGHNAIIHGCTIGNNSLVGMGAKILNGAIIGNNCLIGAGALITQDKNIPDNSIVMGAPGKIIRQLDDVMIKTLAKSAEIYVENARRFANGLSAIE